MRTAIFVRINPMFYDVNKLSVRRTCWRVSFIEEISISNLVAIVFCATALEALRAILNGRHNFSSAFPEVNDRRLFEENLSSNSFTAVS